MNAQSIISKKEGSLLRKTVNVTDMLFDMSRAQEVNFIPSGDITGPKTWVFSNTSKAFIFYFTFTITGIFAQTLPVNFVMADPNWNNSAHVWTPTDIGKYEAIATFNGTSWFLKISGLFVSAETSLYIIGDLEAIFPSYTSAEITSLRVYNFNLFSTDCNSKKLTGETVQVPPGRIEMYYGTGTQFNVSNGEELNIFNQADIVIYPIVRTAGSILFNINTGGKINPTGTGSFAHHKYPNKVEAYNVILAYGGDQTKIKLNTVPRAGFLDSIVGQVIYVSPGITTASVARTVLSYVGDVITLTAPVVVASDTTNYFTNISYKFPTDISDADYDTYSGFWWNDYAYDHYFLYCLPLVAEPNPAIINIGNDLGKFTIPVYISAKNFHLTIEDQVLFYDCVLACAGYSQSTYNLQSIDFERIYLDNTGILILGGNGGVGQPTTAGNLLGSGFYIHPSIIVNGVAHPSTINVNNCKAAAWRWYGFDAAVTKGYTNHITNFIATGVNLEYVLRTSETEETIIDTIDVNNDIVYLNQGTFQNVNAGNVIFFNDGVVTVGTPLSTVGTLSTNLVSVFDKDGLATENVDIGNLIIKLLYNNDYNSFNAILKTNVLVGALSVDTYAGFSPFVYAGVEGGVVFNAIVNSFSGGSTSDVEIIGANIQAFTGIFLGFGSPSNLAYQGRTLIKDSTILCSRIMSCTSYRGFFRDMLTLENCLFYSIAAGQGTSSRFANLVFRIKPLIANVAKVPAVGILEFEFQNEITVNGGGTIRILRPYSYDSQGTKVLATHYYVGNVTIHAVGGNVILEGFDTYSDSNIAVSETILSGNSKVLTCNTDDIRGTLTLGSSKVTATSGALQYTIDLGVYSQVYPESVVTSFGTINLTGGENIAGTSTIGFWDKVNGTIRLDFSSAPTGNITLNYGVYSAVTARGTWS